MGKKEWEYIISPTEIYFTSSFRFPLQRVLQITLDQQKNGALKIVTGIVLLVLSFSIWDITKPNPFQALAILIGIALIVWGLLFSKKYQVGLVILKEPKHYEKVFVPLLKTTSIEEAQEKVQSLNNEFIKNGREKIRIVQSV